MTPTIHEAPKRNPDVPLAILLEGVSDKWQMNVLQILARPTSTQVTVAGHGTVTAPAFILTPHQARYLAKQIMDLLGM